MALKDKATFIAAIDLAAAALTAAWKDENLNSVATEISSPQTPLRQVKKLINLSDDGTFTGDDNYIAQAYAGEFPIKGGQDLSKVVGEPPPLLGIFREYFSGWAGSEQPNGHLGEPGDNISYGLSQFTLGGNDESALFEALVGLPPSPKKIIEVGNPSNFIEGDAIVQPPSDIGLSETYLIFFNPVPSWTIGVPIDGSVCDIVLNP